MAKQSELIFAQWPAPENVHAFTSTRYLPCGQSEGVYAALNLAQHTHDNALQVAENRLCLMKAAGLPSPPFWLNQTHGDGVYRIRSMSDKPEKTVDADASVTSVENAVCAVLTADCLPVFFCNRAGTEVAVAHAGWRGLHAGVLQNTVAAMQTKAEDVLVWFGPAIGPAAFEVGDEVRQAFVEQDAANALAFKKGDDSHFFCDLYQLARLALLSIGVNAFYGEDFCTVSEPNRFYSFRRDGETGRMASLIWLSS